MVNLKIYKCGNRYRLYWKWYLCKIICNVPTYSPVKGINYSNYSPSVTYETEFYNENIVKVAKTVVESESIVVHSKTISPILYQKEHNKWVLKYYYKKGYKQYFFSDTIEECRTKILETQCDWKPIEI